MPKLRIYLDTSVINYVFADDAPEKRDATRAFFETTVRHGKADVFISFLVPDEISRTKDAGRRELLLAVLDEYRLQVAGEGELAESAEKLARRYLDAGILPPKEIDDALHVALATLLRADLLLSWNYKHLANVNREMRFNAANLEAGYTHALRIVTPWEVIDVSTE